MSEMVLPEGWDIKTLSDLGKCVRGLTYSPENVVQHGLLVLRSSNIQNGRLSFEDNVYVNLDVNEEFLSHVGDILICVRNGSKNLIGKSASITRECPKSTHGAFMTVFRSEHNVFVKHLINSEMFFSHLSRDIGATINSINNSNLLQYKFPIPPLSEQHTIASILTSVDEVIEKTEAQISKLQDLKAGMMQELLTKGIGHTEFKDSPVGRIPKEWDALTAQQMLDERILNKLQDGNHGSQYPRTSEFVKSGIHYLAASNISEGGDIDFDNCPRLTSERANQLRIPPAKGGDVILTHNATVGRVAIIPEEFGQVVASTSTTYYRTNKERLLPVYLAQYFLSPPYQLQLKSIMGQTTRNQVPITAQRNLYILFPSLTEQKEISMALSSIDVSLKQVTQKNTQLSELKKALMQDLLTGKVRVKTD